MYTTALLGCMCVLVIVTLPGGARSKWVEGRIDTKENWAFVSRFCFLSLDGQFEYLIEYDREAGTPNLLLYYDDDNQWPSVYHSSKTCKEKEDVLNKAGQNQMIKLSHYYPDTEYSGCIITKQNKEVPASKSSTTSTSTTTKPSTTTTKKPQSKPKDSPNTTKPPDPSYYNQFLKTTTHLTNNTEIPLALPKTTIPPPKTTESPPKTTTQQITTITDSNSTIWYELVPSDFIISTTNAPEEEWESIGTERDGNRNDNLMDVELMFTNKSHNKIKRSTALYERFRRRRLNSESNQQLYSNPKINTDKYIVSCHNSRRFHSARERWWFIAISNCESTKGLDLRYRFLMTNGPEGDFWHEHFSADEFYVLPVLLAYVFAYLIVIIAVVMCSIELRSRHLLHTTYKMFLLSTVLQYAGILIQALAKIKYAANGFGGENTCVVGQFMCGMSETTFILVLVLMGKGYTITRARLKVSFTIKLTVFMCCYIVTYVVLFVYQAKAFDPGEVLYLYESPAGYGLIVLRVFAWCMFAYSIFFTVKKYPEKNMFYCPFSISGTLWFFAGPLFILTANSYIDKWVRESVVTAVLLFITFCGHIMFLLLTLPVFANKNFPYHVRTTQIGVMEVTGNPDLDRFGHNPYQPTNGTTQTVIIPLTRRTEELIGSMYTQYVTSPHASLENETPKLNGFDRQTNSLSPKSRLTQQESVETNNSDDIKPYLHENKDIFTVEGQIAKIEATDSLALTDDSSIPKPVLPVSGQNLPSLESSADVPNRNDLPNVLRSRRNILEPIKRDVPSWSLAKGPAVVEMLKKSKGGDDEDPESPIQINGRKVPPVRNGLSASSGEISTILEGRVQSYKNMVSQPTIDLFNVQRKAS